MTAGGRYPTEAESAVAAALAAIAPPEVVVGCRRIRPGDEDLLTAAERATIRTGPVEARRASGAVRDLARRLIGSVTTAGQTQNAGGAAKDILRGPGGAPVFPTGVLGSLAHDDDFAVAALARAGGAIRTLGIDVEPAAPLEPAVAALVIADGDRLGGVGERLSMRLLFSAKEAVYKASFPLDGRVLDYADIAIDFDRGRALASGRHRFSISFTVQPRIVCLAASMAGGR